MNEIKVIVNFKARTVNVLGTSLTVGDYNSTKLIFEFDKPDGIKIIEMKNPSGQIVLLQEIQNNEIILARFNDGGQASSIFNESGRYPFEISLYDNNSKLSSAVGVLKVQSGQVIVDDVLMEEYMPVFDELINDIQDSITQVNNMDIDASKEDGTTSVTLTKKDGTTKTIEINDGVDGQDGNDYVITESDYNAIALMTKEHIDIPTHLSELTDDSTHRLVTDTNINNWNSKSNFSGNYNDLVNKPTIPVVPTTLSSFTDDLGSSPTHTHSQYLTSYSETDPTVPSHVKNISQNDITSWTNKQDAITIATTSDVDALFGTSLDADGVYLLKTSAWFNPYCFVWNDSEQVAYVDWSGEAMVDTGYTYHNYHIYKYTYPTNLYDMCIFSNHGANQTRDLVAQVGKCYDSTTNQWLDITVYPVVTNSKIVSLGDLKEYNDKIQNTIGDIESLLSEV